MIEAWERGIFPPSGSGSHVLESIDKNPIVFDCTQVISELKFERKLRFLTSLTEFLIKRLHSPYNGKTTVLH